MRTSGSLSTSEGFEKTYGHYLDTMGVVATFDEVPTELDLDETKRDPDFDAQGYLALRRTLGDNN